MAPAWDVSVVAAIRTPTRKVVVLTPIRTPIRNVSNLSPTRDLFKGCSIVIPTRVAHIILRRTKLKARLLSPVSIII